MLLLDCAVTRSELCEGEGRVEERASLECSQVWEVTAAGQPDWDPVTRPVPHISSAEQCTGEAVSPTTVCKNC